ncbi:MAG TPA: hypothetical protein VGY56_21080, partial [Verrucomicrobiae bacterium]|nr:hypothetical protein [Verrucomicrobiae bacterium]
IIVILILTCRAAVKRRRVVILAFAFVRQRMLVGLPPLEVRGNCLTNTGLNRPFFHKTPTSFVKSFP